MRKMGDLMRQQRKLRNWVPTVIGFFAGGLIGCILLLIGIQYPDFPILSLIFIPVECVAGFLRRVFLPNSDPMAAMVFLVPVTIIFCAIIGSVIGFVVQIFLVGFERSDDE
jgi:hypothetical protein